VEVLPLWRNFYNARDERYEPDQSAQGVGKWGIAVGNSRRRISPVNPPAIQGLGSFGGRSLRQDRRGNSGSDTLVQAMGEVLGRANQTPGLCFVFSTFAAKHASIPGLKWIVQSQDTVHRRRCL